MVHPISCTYDFATRGTNSRIRSLVSFSWRVRTRGLNMGVAAPRLRLLYLVIIERVHTAA